MQSGKDACHMNSGNVHSPSQDTPKKPSLMAETQRVPWNCTGSVNALQPVPENISRNLLAIRSARVKGLWENREQGVVLHQKSRQWRKSACSVTSTIPGLTAGFRTLTWWLHVPLSSLSQDCAQTYYSLSSQGRGQFSPHHKLSFCREASRLSRSASFGKEIVLTPCTF